MASQKRIEANRRNAQRSTGPRSADGKARSRLNALKHGLSASLPAVVATAETAALAAALVPADAGPEARSAAARLALAETMLEKVRAARAAAGVQLDGPDASAEALAAAASHMAALDRYERRARRMAAEARRTLTELDGRRD
ncbi:hypothetical protein [Alsobacter sp. R-9]